MKFPKLLSSISKLRRTLYWKISFVLLSLLVGTMAAQFFLFAFYWNHISDESEQLLNWGIAAELSQRFQPWLATNSSFSELQHIAHEFTTANPKIEIYLINGQGEIEGNFAEFTDGLEKSVSLLPIQKFLQVGSRQHAPIYGDDPSARTPNIFSVAEIRIGEHKGFVYVILRSARQRKVFTVFRENSAFSGTALGLTMTTGCSALIGLAAFFILTRRFQRVTAVVDKFRQGNFSERLTVKSADEIDTLAETVNKMADTIVANIDQLQERDRLRRELIANVSHDLRGPVAIIKGYLELLSDEDVSFSGEEFKDCVNILNKNTDSLNTLLLELFELAKLEASEAKPKLIPFSIDALAEEIVSGQMKAAQSKNISLSLQSTAQLPLVYGDVAMIGRVLSNLLTNAIRYTNNDGTVELRLIEKDEFVNIKVVDTGVGIAEKDIPLVFEKFYCVEKSGQKQAGSTGLGLAIVKRIVEMHDSKISLSSTENVGSTFSFDLKVASGHV